jgi:hypothetical protein
MDEQLRKLVRLTTEALSILVNGGNQVTIWDDLHSEWLEIDDISRNAIRKRLYRIANNYYPEAVESGKIGEGEYKSFISDYFMERYPSTFRRSKKFYMKNDKVISETNDRYHYLEDSNSYVFYLKSMPKPVKISERDLRLLKQRYSDWDGSKSTINEICLDFGIIRPVFTELKTLLGWTHSSDPWLDFDIENEPDDEVLVDEVLQRRRANLKLKVEQQSYQEIKRDAEKFYDLEQSVVKPLMDRVEDKMGTYVKKDINISPLIMEEPKCAIIPIFDIHVGKLHYRDKYLNIDQFVEDCMASFEHLMSKVTRFKLEKLIVPVGSDFFHVDNMGQTTTKGTPQTNNMGISTVDMFTSGMELSYRMNDIIVDLGIETSFPTISGNHDHLLSISLGEALKQRYRNDSHVDVDVSKYMRKYSRYGRSLFGITHGEELPLSKNSKRASTISKLMLREPSQFGIDTSGINNYYYLSGHQHKFDISDSEGVMDIVVPSLAKPDFWHHTKSYDFKESKVASYIFDKEIGLDDIVLGK